MKNINIDDIKVSSKLDEVIKNATTEGYNNIKHKDIRPIRKIAITTTIAASLSVFVLGAIFNSNTIVNAVKRIFSKNPVENFKLYNSVDLDKENYKTIVEQSVSDNGITITVNEVVFDYNQILVSYTMNSDTVDTSSLLQNPSIFINGTEIRKKSVDDTISEDNKFRLFTLIPSVEIPRGKDLDIKIVFGGEDPLWENDEIIKSGHWEFNFKANTDGIFNASKIINIEKEFILPDDEVINIENLTITPVSTFIKYSCEDKQLDGQYPFEILNPNGELVDIVHSMHSYNTETNRVDVTAIFKNISDKDSFIKVIPLLNNEKFLDISFDINLN